MSKNRIKQKSKKNNKKIKNYTAHAGLCAIAPVIKDKKVFEIIQQKVLIPQKKKDYHPTDKLIFSVLSIMSGCSVIFDINRIFRVDRALLRAFGYRKCADQSVIQDTLNAAEEQNVTQLESALKEMWYNFNMAGSFLKRARSEGTIETIDMDLTGMPAGKQAECSTKGYFSGEKNIHGRQLARIVFPKTQEIVAETLYPGNMTSCKTFKGLVEKMEDTLQLTDESQREHIRLRLDAGFGTDENINYALWRGYQILVKMYSGNRARSLARSVHEWINISSGADNKPRQAGWLTRPHRYGKQTKQLAIRKLGKKGKGYQYSVIVGTDMDADIQGMTSDYDGRSGAPESSFCQDNQGLGMKKRRKRGFVAQQMLMLLTQLAHNLIRWTQNWMISAVEQTVQDPKSSVEETDEPSEKSVPAEPVVRTLKEYGMKRFVKQIFCLIGKVQMKEGKVSEVIINPLHPLIRRIIIAFKALLKPYRISVSLGKI